MRKPTVTIIIVTFNAEKHLRDCFRSIIKQNSGDLQLVVIDGGSTDSTLEIIKEYDNLIDVWITEADKGVYDAMNKGLKYVEGQWVLFLGADDQLESGFRNMVEELKNPKAVYYGMVNVGGTIYKDRYTSYRLSKLNICHQTIFYSKSIFEKYRYDLKYALWADWFLNIQCWKDSSVEFIYKPYLISKFGTQGISSLNEDAAFQRDRSSIIFENFGAWIWLRFTVRKIKQKLRHER